MERKLIFITKLKLTEEKKQKAKKQKQTKKRNGKGQCVKFVQI